MLNKIKLALRISHDYLNSEILDNVEEARAEMIRLGVSHDKAYDRKDALVSRAIKTFCIAALSDDSKTAEGYQKSWEYQIDNLRKSSSYAESGDSDVQPSN